MPVHPWSNIFLTCCYWTVCWWAHNVSFSLCVCCIRSTLCFPWLVSNLASRITTILGFEGWSLYWDTQAGRGDSILLSQTMRLACVYIIKSQISKNTYTYVLSILNYLLIRKTMCVNLIWKRDLKIFLKPWTFKKNLILVGKIRFRYIPT